MRTFIIRLFDSYRVPAEARDTFRYDLRYGLSKGLVLAGSASVAGVILKKTFASSDFEVALLHASVSLGLLFSIGLAVHAEKPDKMNYAYYPDMAARWLFILIAPVVALTGSSMAFTLTLCAAYALNAINTPVITSIYRSNYPDHARAKIMAIVRTLFNLAFVASSYVFGLMLDVDGHNYIYVYPIIGIAGIWGCRSFRKIRVIAAAENGNRPPKHPLQEFRRVMSQDKPFAFFMAYWALFGFAALMVDPVKTIYVTDPRFDINASYEEAVLAVTVIPQAVMMLTFAFWGRQIDKYGVIRIRFLLNILPTINLLLFYFATDLKLIYLASVLQGISMSGQQLSWQLCVMEFAPKNQVGIYMGIHTMLTGARGIVAPFVGAALIGGIGIGPTFLVGFGLMAFSTIMLLRFSQHRDRHDLESGITREYVPKALAE